MSFRTKNLIYRLWDIDGTLADTKPPHYTLSKALPIIRNVEILKKQYERGDRIYIWTSRHGDDTKYIKRWLRKYDIPFFDVWTSKPLVAAFYDDKAVNLNCKECYERASK